MLGPGPVTELDWARDHVASIEYTYAVQWYNRLRFNLCRLPPMHLLVSWLIFGAACTPETGKEGRTIAAHDDDVDAFCFFISGPAFAVSVSTERLMKPSATTIPTHVETIDGLIDCLPV